MVVHMILAISFMFYPFFTKRNIFFGIKIPLKALMNKKILKIKYQFMVLTGITGTMMIVLGIIYAGSMNLIFVAISIYMGIYLYAHMKTKQLKRISHWQVDEHVEVVIETSFRHMSLVVSKGWYVLYLGILLITMVVIQMKFETLPEMLSMQINNFGREVVLLPKGKVLSYLVGIQLIVMMLMVLIQYIIKHAKQDLSGPDMTVSVEENIRFRQKFSRILYVFGFIISLNLMFSTFFTMGILQNTTLFLVLVLGLLLLLTIYLLASGFKYGQDGNRLNKLMEAPSDAFIDKEDDRYWLLGMIYFNKRDPAIFIGKRVGIGWSVNHARWQAWLLYIGIIGLIIITTVVL